MSYLLEALRKSDRERRQSEEPALASIHLQQRFGPRRGQRRWLGATAAFVLVLLAAGTWWVWQNGVVALPKLTFASRPESAAKPEAHAAAETATASKAAAPSAVATQSLQHAPAATEPPDEATLPTLGNLPATVRNRIPALRFSLHAYSDDPSRRSMVVNDRVVHEGDRIADNLTLVKITADGAVLRYRDTWFRVNVLENW